MKHSLTNQNQSAIGSRKRAILISLGLLLCLLGALCPSATVSAQDAFPLNVTFKDASAPGWVLGGTAILTSNNADPAGNGWLRLTDNTTYKAGYAYYNTPIPTQESDRWACSNETHPRQ